MASAPNGGVWASLSAAALRLKEPRFRKWGPVQTGGPPLIEAESRTVASLLDELEHARARADGLDQLSAAVKAISEKARISGLLVQRVEVGGPGDFAGCDSTEAMADKILADSASGPSMSEIEVFASPVSLVRFASR